MNNSMLPLRGFLAAVISGAALLLAACYGDGPDDLEDTICCGDSVAPTYLQSKIDDDDGDGNPYDEDFPAVDDEDDDIADHAWIRDGDGIYHLFFNTEDHGSGSFIEHYVSSDLRNLEYIGPALRANPNGWDSYSIWAPHIVRNGGTYLMFYTGTDGPGEDPQTKQRIGLAISMDLMSWTRYPINRCPGTEGAGCIYECNECWTAWGEAVGSFNQQCRDPFVVWDAAEHRWLLLATAKSVNGYGVVTVAHSTNLFDWSGAGFIDATRRLATGVGAQTTGGQAENPFVASNDGVYYLFFTDWQDPEDSVTTPYPRTIAQYVTSTTLAADTSGSANWVYRSYTPDPGVNAIEVLRAGNGVSIMSQSISNERSGLWPRRRQLRLRCVTWGSDFTFGLSNVDFSCGAARSAHDPARP